jgi:hypothetical protein
MFNKLVRKYYGNANRTPAVNSAATSINAMTDQ